MSRLLALSLILLLHAAPSLAGDQDDARRALQAGEIRPLEEVLAAARAAVPGEVVKLDLKRDNGRWVYELKILTASGKRREVEIDGRSLAVVDDDDDD